MKGLSEFLSENWGKIRAMLATVDRSRRYRSHFPSYTKKSKRTTREHNRARNRIARMSRRINRRRAAG